MEGSEFSSIIPSSFWSLPLLSLSHFLLGAGIYLSEYAKKGPVTNLVRTCIEILSSLPSVVVGLFGYLIFVVQFEYGFSIISGALALTVFNLPQMTRNVEDSLKHVHHTQREAGS